MGIKIGIVGCGRFAPGFIRFFRDHPAVDAVSLCDIKPERVAANLERFGLEEGYTSIDEMCASDADAVAVMTQPWLHAPQAIQVMESGKHVWSAVPLIMLPDGNQMLEWCNRVVETSRRTGMYYFLAETSYYYPGAMYCRNRASEGAFGSFYHADGVYSHDYRHPNSNLTDIAKHRWGDEWDNTKSGGIPMHYPTHSLGGILSVVQAHVTKVSCLGYEFPDDEWFRDDTVYGNRYCSETALMRLSNGMTVRLAEWRRAAGPCYEGFSLYGTEGYYVEIAEGQAAWAPRHQPGVTLNMFDPAEYRTPLPPDVLEAFTAGAEQAGSVYGGHQGSHAYLVHEFVDAVANERPPAIGAHDAARYLVPGVMAHRSAQRDGEWLEVPDWGSGS